MATEDEITRFQAGRFDPAPDTVIKRLRETFPEIGDPLEQMKRLAWRQWSGFTHSGHAHLSNWVTEGAIGPTHSLHQGH